VIRLALRAGLLLLMGGGVWLYGVRGEAILLDLQEMASRVLCF